MNTNYHKEEYISRINHVIDYIEKNLDRELQLEELSRVANFSKFHFHRIFKAVTGEALIQFIQRLRVEKAASLLQSNPEKSITSIAYDCGFGSSASFGRAFKEYFSVSPGEWKKANSSKNSKISIEESKIGKDQNRFIKYIFDKLSNLKGKKEAAQKDTKPVVLNVDVRDLPDIKVAYVRHIGPQIWNLDIYFELLKKLVNWAKAHDVATGLETEVMTVYHDHPDITENPKLRASVCVKIPEQVKVGGEIGEMIIHGGRYAIAHFENRLSELTDIWSAVYSDWLPGSGYQPDDRLAFEICHYEFQKKIDDIYKIDICIPVEPL